MADLSDYPEEHPETSKVKNPLTGNWVKQSYAKKQDLLEQAKQHTQQHFKEQDSETRDESEEIDDLLNEAENVDPGEAFDLDDEELERLDERADINHPEIPDSKFPDEEGFDPAAEEEEGFQQPPTPEGIEQAARQNKSSGEHKGIYSGASSARNRKPQTSSRSELEKKHDNDEVKYVRTEQGGMKMLYPGDEGYDEA